MSITNLEVSFYRYLYEQLEVAKGIRLFEAVDLEAFTALTEWIVIETLTNPLGAAPKQLYFLHISLQKGMKNEKILLSRLIDKVVAAVNNGVRFPIYDYDTAEQIGQAEIIETSLSPMMNHVSGGCFRSLTVGVAYAGN